MLELLREGGRRADARADDPTSSALPCERRLYRSALLPAVGPPHPSGAEGCRAALAELASELRALGLSRREVLMCADLRPRSAVELHAIVADCDDRLGGGGEEEEEEEAAAAAAAEGEGAAADGASRPLRRQSGVDAALAAVARHAARRRAAQEAGQRASRDESRQKRGR